MNKTELIALAAENSGLAKKDAERVINATLDAVTNSLMNGEKVQLSGCLLYTSDAADEL